MDEFPEKFPKGKGGHFWSKKKKFRSEKFHCKFSAGATSLRKKSQYNFPKKGQRGGQRPFGNFPEIHPFWWRQASLRMPSCSADPSSQASFETLWKFIRFGALGFPYKAAETPNLACQMSLVPLSLVFPLMILILELVPILILIG